MTTLRRILSMLFVTVMALSVSAMATFSPAGTIVNRALEEVTELYTDIYTISDASAYLMNQTMDENGNAVYIVETSFKRTLKAASALEIPAIAGMIEAKNSWKILSKFRPLKNISLPESLIWRKTISAWNRIQMSLCG